MNIKISNKIEFGDSISELSKDGNAGSIDWAYSGDSEKLVNNTDGLVSQDFKLTNANKFIYELKPNNTFDLLLQQDVIKSDSIDKISSLHIFCYESSSIRQFRLPIKFDVFLEDMNVSLGKMSEFCLGNVKDLSSDIRISGISVPAKSKATLVIIIAIND